MCVHKNVSLKDCLYSVVGDESGNIKMKTISFGNGFAAGDVMNRTGR
jgi:hypothetical protein